MKMATIKEWLDNAGFDWDVGTIIYQTTPEGGKPGWSDPIESMVISKNNPILTKDFYDGFGGPECPRFIAEDHTKIYFPSQYDGSTSLCFVFKDLNKYLNITNKTPYPGK